MPIAYTILYSLFGPKPFFFHFLQVSLHILNTVLLYCILSMLFGKYHPKDEIIPKVDEKEWKSLSRRQRKKHKRMLYGAVAKASLVPDLKTNLLPFFLSLIFLVHPINTETVVNISDLDDTLFLFFGMLGFYLILKKGIGGYKQLLLICASLFFSLLSKETGIAFILILLFYVWQFHKKQFVSYLLANTVIVSLYLFLRLIVANLNFNNHALVPIGNQNLSHRLLSLPKILLFYIKTFLFPKDLAVGQYWVVKEASFLQFLLPYLIVLIVFSVLTFFAFMLKKRDAQLFKLYLFFLVWFIIGLGIHSQIVPVDFTVADHWFYFPIVGALGLIGVGLQTLKPSYQHHNLYYIGVLVLLSIFSLRSFIRTFDWRNNLALYSHDIQEEKDNYILLDQLARELFFAGKYDEAISYEKQSVSLSPTMI